MGARKSFSLALDDQLCFALYAASRAVTSAYAEHLAPLGLTYPQYLVMLVLWEGDGLAVREIGARLHLDSGTLTPLLKRLESRGLVERKRQSKDERVVSVFLSPEGRALRRKARSIPGNLVCRYGGAEADIAALREALHLLTETIRGEHEERNS